MANETILMIDDDKSLLKAVGLGLKKESMNIDLVNNAKDFMDYMQSKKYDAILIDLQMPDVDGFELVQELRSRKIFTPIVIISGREEEHNKILGLGLGADDYITKPFSIHLLHSKLKALIRRNNRYQQEEKKELVVGPFRLDKDTLDISRNGEILELTSKERKLLKLFLEHPNQVFTKEQLYGAVWQDVAVDDNTIMVYIKRLRKKIEQDSKNPRYLVTVWGIGYQFKS